MPAYGINFVDGHNNAGNAGTPDYMDYYNDAMGVANEYRPGDFTTGNWLKRQEDLKREVGQLVYNSQEAQKNRDFQEYMSKTEVQRRVKDLEAAGFSPMMLLSSSVGPASSPSGSAATGSGYKSSTSKKSGLGDLAALAIRVLGLLALKK